MAALFGPPDYWKCLCDCGRTLGPCCPGVAVPSGLQAVVTFPGWETEAVAGEGGSPWCAGEFVIDMTLAGGTAIGGTDTLACEACCDAGVAIPRLIQNSLWPLFPEIPRYYYHGGGSVMVGGSPFTICVILCACDDSTSQGGSLPDLGTGNPNDAIGQMLVLHRESNTAICRQIRCGTIAGVYTFDSTIGTSYCSNSSTVAPTVSIVEAP